MAAEDCLSGSTASPCLHAKLWETASRDAPGSMLVFWMTVVIEDICFLILQVSTCEVGRILHVYPQLRDPESVTTHDAQHLHRPLLFGPCVDIDVSVCVRRVVVPVQNCVSIMLIA